MSRAGRLLPWGMVSAAIAGLGVSVYLTAVHASAAPLVCSSSGPVNCEHVLTSSYAQLLGTGVPTSAAGIVWFLVSGVLAALQAARPGDRAALRLGLAWSAVGLLTVLGLVFVEIVLLGTLCAWCTTAHVLVLLTLILGLARLENVTAS